MQEPSKQYSDWIEKYQHTRLRKNAKIPKEHSERLKIFYDWKNSISQEEFNIASNKVLFEFRLKNQNPIEHFPHLNIERIYYAKQFEKDKCGCKFTNRVLAKWECPGCVYNLSIYENDQYYARLVKLFKKFEDIKIEEINEWYIACNKSYDATKDTIMADHDIDDSQLPEDIHSVEIDEELGEEIIEEPAITGSKRTREEAQMELIDLDLLEEDSGPSLIASFDAANFNSELINALIFAGAEQNRKKFKTAKR